MEKEISSNNYDITHEIEEQRFFTTEDIAKILDCTPSVIRNITSYYHINSEEMVRDKRVKYAVYSYQAFKEIKWYRDRRLAKARAKYSELFPERTEEEIAALEDHSLVTDKRCLDLNYWPDVIPSCFAETEEKEKESV